MPRKELANGSCCTQCRLSTDNHSLDGRRQLWSRPYVHLMSKTNSSEFIFDEDNLPDDGFLFRRSAITPEMDADYLAAVERGDMETAQRMVIEAAKLAMPNTKVVDENGNPLVLYHGTPSNFNIFKKDKFGRTDAGSMGKGFYFTSSESFADRYKGDEGRLIRVFLNIENPITENNEI